MGNCLSRLRGGLRPHKDPRPSYLDANLPQKPSWVTNPDPLASPNEDEWFLKLRDAVEENPLSEFDPGVLSEELLNLNIYEKVGNGKSEYAGGNIKEGTYAGTQAAMTQIYDRLEKSYGSYMDVLGIENTLPRYIDLEEKKNMYQFSAYPNEEDGQPAFYPPHLQTIPKADDEPLWKIFNALGLAESGLILLKVVPDTFLGRTAEWILEKVREGIEGSPEDGFRISDVERYNKYHRRSGTDIMRGDNIGLLDDWFSDRRFAEQSFTGTNPTTLTRAPDALVDEFIQAAGVNGYKKWSDELPKVNRDSLMVQDCSYFRKAVGVDSGAEMHHQTPGNEENWACAPVTLFQLHDDGKLHPVAITIDYKDTMANSVTIFNQRMKPSDSTKGEENDWPWRYAKTCAQVGDWARHELAVHLTEAHFIEEAVIVATNRTIPMDHIIFRLLHPHWYKTLSLNAAARDTLVPQVIRELVGFSPEQTSAFIRHAYDTYDWVGNYVPAQLADRGFPSDLSQLQASPKYKNYPYAKNMLGLWSTTGKYVRAMLAPYYPDDASVASDSAILSSWCAAIRGSSSSSSSSSSSGQEGGEGEGAAHIASFPAEIATVDDLADAITMCIHVASPYHTAVNYLQNFYQSFVIAKPPALCRALPESLNELRRYAERDLVASLPMNRQRQWLLASQIPWLLSFKVAGERSLLNFALSQWNVYKRKGKTDVADGGEDNDEERGRKERMAAREIVVRDASRDFYQDLLQLAKGFFANSRAMDDGAVPYMVLDPANTAVSILI